MNFFVAVMMLMCPLMASCASAKEDYRSWYFQQVNSGSHELSVQQSDIVIIRDTSAGQGLYGVRSQWLQTRHSPLLCCYAVEGILCLLPLERGEIARSMALDVLRKLYFSKGADSAALRVFNSPKLRKSMAESIINDALYALHPHIRAGDFCALHVEDLRQSGEQFARMRKTDQVLKSAQNYNFPIFEGDDTPGVYKHLDCWLGQGEDLTEPSLWIGPRLRRFSVRVRYGSQVWEHYVLSGRRFCGAVNDVRLFILSSIRIAISSDVGWSFMQVCDDTDALRCGKGCQNIKKSDKWSDTYQEGDVWLYRHRNAHVVRFCFPGGIMCQYALHGNHSCGPELQGFLRAFYDKKSTLEVKEGIVNKMRVVAASCLSQHVTFDDISGFVMCLLNCGDVRTLMQQKTDDIALCLNGTFLTDIPETMKQEYDDGDVWVSRRIVPHLSVPWVGGSLREAFVRIRYGPWFAQMSVDDNVCDKFFERLFCCGFSPNIFKVRLYNFMVASVLELQKKVPAQCHNQIFYANESARFAHIVEKPRFAED